MANYRYGAYDDGPDPLAPPYDVREALDEMGERILAGDSPRDALRDLMRRGWQDRRGLDDPMGPVPGRERELRDDARLRGPELDALPSAASRAIRELADYEWRSAEARQKFEQLRDLLRREVLD